MDAAQETTNKGKRSHSKEKPIKIKLTTRDNQAQLSGSEDEDEPEAAIEEHLILRLPEGEMCEQFREMVRRREIPEDVKLHLKGVLDSSFLRSNDEEKQLIGDHVR